MPKSKRDRVIHLTKTAKKGKDQKKALIDTTREYVDTYSHIYVFEVQNMRNSTFKDIRLQWPTSKFQMGKNKVVQLALGRDKSSELKPNIRHIARQVAGNRGVFFTHSSPDEVLPKFVNGVDHFARTGFVATDTIELKAGPLPPIITVSMEPNMRKLELDTEIREGVVYLRKDTVVCTKGEELKPNQAKILEYIGIKMAKFKINFLYHWHDGVFNTLEGAEVPSMDDDDNENSKALPNLFDDSDDENMQ